MMVRSRKLILFALICIVVEGFSLKPLAPRIIHSKMAYIPLHRQNGLISNWEFHENYRLHSAHQSNLSDNLELNKTPSRWDSIVTHAKKIVKNINTWMNQKKKMLGSIVGSLSILIMLVLVPITMRKPAFAVSGGVIGGSSSSRSALSRSNDNYRQRGSSRSQNSGSNRHSGSRPSYSFNPTVVNFGNSGAMYARPMSDFESKLTTLIGIGFILSLVLKDRNIDFFSQSSYSSSLQYVQLCFFVNEDEKRTFLNDMAKLTESHNRRSNGNSLHFVDMAFDLSVILMRLCQRETLIGGRMDLWRYSNSNKNKEKLQGEFDRLSITEQSKFQPEVVDTLNIDFNTPSRQSHIVVTILVEASGPVPKGKAWAQRDPSLWRRILLPLSDSKPPVPSSTDIQEYLIGLPKYLREISTLESKALYGDDDNPMPGFKINILWLPNKADEVLYDGEIRLKWPELYAV